MAIVLFEDITTESILQELEASGKKYTGLYADLEDADARKYIKGEASKIGGMIKALDRARIDKVKDYKLKVDTEAAEIKQRLEEANRPLSLLIDDYTKKRAEVLAKKKRIEDARLLAIEIDDNHEIALLMDAKVMADKKAAEDERIAYESKLKEEAAAEAVKNEQMRIERDDEVRRVADADRLANKEHLKEVNNAVLVHFVLIGISETMAITTIKKIVNGEIPNVTINY